MVTVLNAKCRSLYLQKKKPAQIGWTTSWRKGHKKMATLAGGRRRVRRRERKTRAIVGLNLDELKKRKSTNFHTVTKQAAMKTVKKDVKSKAKKSNKKKKTFGMSKNSRAAMKHAGKGR